MTAAPSTCARTAALALTLSLAAGLAAGCDTKSFGYAGQPIPEFFPLDSDLPLIDVRLRVRAIEVQNEAPRA